jgi:predicted porin
MKTVLATTALVFATVSGAFAATTALDVYQPVKNEAAVDYVATASIGNGAVIRNDRLGDGSPVYSDAGSRIDFTATSAIGNGTSVIANDRLGDGSPSY